MLTGTRTERFREATKRQIMGVLMDSTNGNNGVEPSSSSGKLKDMTNENRVSLMVQDLQKGLDRQLDGIKADVATWKQEQVQAHYSGMMKIPKATRQLTVKEFNEKYNCNLLDLLKNVGGNHSALSGHAFAKPPICGTKRDRALQTPAPTKGRLPMQTPGGTIRTVRKGEMM
jgi:hypothetical protein